MKRRPNILLIVTDQEQWQSLPFQVDFATEFPARERLRCEHAAYMQGT